MKRGNVLILNLIKIHSDVWGLMSKLGCGELLCFINDLSKYYLLNINLKYLKGSKKFSMKLRIIVTKDKRFFNHEEIYCFVPQWMA